MSYLWLKTFIITLEHALRHGQWCSSLGYFDGFFWWKYHGFPAGAMICPLVPPTSWRYSPCHYSCRPPCRIPRRVLPANAQPRRQPNTLMGPIKPALTATSCLELPKNWWYPPTHVIELSGKLCISTHQIYGSSREFSDQYFISCCWLILYSDKLYSMHWGTDTSRKSTEF